MFESSNYKSFAPNNRLSSLPNNIINYLGIYLTKEQSIILGYTDRTLYIASQYKLFIINRRSIKHDKPLNLDKKVFKNIINFNSNTHKYNSKGWIKFGVSYCYPSCIFIENVPLFSKYKNKIQENMKLFATFFQALKFIINVPDTTQCNYWQFLPIELIFDKSIKIFKLSGADIDRDHDINGIDLEFRFYISSQSSWTQSLTMLCERYEKYVETIENLKFNKDDKIAQVKSLKVCPNLVGYDMWEMLYTRLIVQKCQKLILEIITRPKDYYNYEEFGYYNDATIRWSIFVNQSNDKFCINFAKIKEQCNKMNWNPKVLHITIPPSIGTNDNKICQIYDQLFVDYFSKTETILIRMMAGNDGFDSTYTYADGYEYSHAFLITLLQCGDIIRKWKNLNKYIFSIQWNFNLDKQETIKRLHLSKTKLKDTVLTHPLVPLTLRKEFEYKPLKSGVYSKTVDITGNCSYKSFGNIWYNSRKWISDYYQNCDFANSTLQFRVNIAMM